MTEPRTNPPRLLSLPDSEDALGVGRMFREARELPDEALPRLQWRLRTSQRLSTMRPRLVARAALVVGIAFCTGGVVGAVVSPLLAGRKSVAVVAPVPAAAATPRHAKARTASSSAAAPALPDPIPDDSGAAVEKPTSAPDEPKRVVAPARPRTGAGIAVTSEIEPSPVEPPPLEPTAVSPAVEAPAVVSPRVVSSPIAAEQALLGQTIRTLRDGHDPRSALSLLAQYADRFPAGAFASEASVLRIESLLALGQGHDALVLLDGISLASLPNQDEQRVVRGELRADDRRWREAAQDFDDALRGRDVVPAGTPKARSLQERALWGRAAARSRLGDQAGARADLELYLRVFPAGRFAAASASLLRGAP